MSRSAGFSLYVSNFGSYSSTYGSLAGGIVLLLWLWLTNVAVVFGAQFAAELERTANAAREPAPPGEPVPLDPAERAEAPHYSPPRSAADHSTAVGFVRSGGPDPTIRIWAERGEMDRPGLSLTWRSMSGQGRIEALAGTAGCGSRSPCR